MKTAGIVAEYNPFHTGHAYQIARTRGLLGADCAVVAVMSGNWVQRGACAAADKWTRAGWALAGGADLVLELPTVWAASAAESFATGAVALLRACGVVDVLSFGSESGDPAALAAAAACLDSEAYRAGLSRFLDEGMPFAACRQAVVAALLGSERAKVLSRPNDNLGVEYLRAASALGWSPQVLAVPRQGAGHDAPRPAEGFASASILREWIAAGRRDLADCFLPAPWPEELEPPPCPTWSVPSWPVSALCPRRSGPSSRTPVWRRGFLPGSSRREAGPCLWRNFSPWPRPSGTPTPACAVSCCGPSWA